MPIPPCLPWSALGAVAGAVVACVSNRRKAKRARPATKGEKKAAAVKQKVERLKARESALLQTVRRLERDVEAQRQVKLAELDQEMANQKKLAINELMAWSDAEKHRLARQYGKEYQPVDSGARAEITTKFDDEFDQIRAFLAAFANNEKPISEKDILQFLDRKRAERSAHAP